MGLRLDRLHKSFGAVAAVQGVSLDLTEQGTLALLGPSGCGKSTLLRLIAGLERPDEGRVFIGGRDVTFQPPQRRGVGMVFQDYALFPHLDVAGNVAFALVERRHDQADVRARVSELLELVGLAGFERRKVYQLSGGQQQRVALARALAAEPSLLLLDEPLSNLDPELRLSLQRELAELLSGVAVQAIYVTHDQAEAMAVARRVAVMRSGRIEQVGDGTRLMAHPRTAWLARFLGYRNVFPATSPVARGDTPLLLRDDLVRPGGVLSTRIEEVERVGHRLRLTLRVADWGVAIVWEGYRREVAEEPVPGDEFELDVPDRAWLELEGP